VYVCVHLFITQILAIICVSQNGISEMQLSDLIPELTVAFRTMLCYVLQQYLILTPIAGLLVFANGQVNEIILLYSIIYCLLCFIKQLVISV